MLSLGEEPVRKSIKKTTYYHRKNDIPAMFQIVFYNLNTVATATCLQLSVTIIIILPVTSVTYV